MNTTVRGNETAAGGASPGQGAGIYAGGPTTLRNATVTANQAALTGPGQGCGVYANAATTFTNSIVAGNLVGATLSNCFVGAGSIGSDHDLEDGTSCGFTSPGDSHATSALSSSCLRT